MRAHHALLLLIFLTFASRLATAKDANSSAAVAGMNRKLQHIQTNGALAHPDPAPTEITEQEANAYVASGAVDLPPGMQSVTFQGAPGVITATARVDFDQLKTGTHSSNPLLAIFSGVHDVVIVAHAHGNGGRGFVQVDSVSLDGVEIPRFVLQLFVEKYLQPKYPNIGLDSQFTLPERIDSAVVGSHKVTLIQR